MALQFQSDVTPLTTKIIGQRRLALWFNSYISALKQSARKLERKWRSTNLEEPQLVWTDRVMTEDCLLFITAIPGFFSALTACQTWLKSDLFAHK